VGIGKQLLVYGGINTKGQFLNDLWLFMASNRQWRQLPIQAISEKDK